MKARLASTIASLSVLAIVSAFEIPYYDKMSLGFCGCQNLQLTDGHVLHGTCTNSGINPSYRVPVDLSLDLNNCFANYLGNLNHVSNGGFSSTCSSCHMNGTKLACDCSIGKDLGRKHSEYELDDWRTIRMTSSDFNMDCGSTEGLEKRVDNKKARPFLA